MAGSERYNLAGIRAFLREAFTAEELRRFCQERLLFGDLRTRFGPNYNLEQMIDAVFDFCDTRLLWGEFLAATQEANPKQYALFADEIGGPAGGAVRQRAEAYAPPPPPDLGTLPPPDDPPPGSRLPYHRNALFTGRAGALLALARGLLGDAPRPHLIQGIGGVGKTQLAVEFAYRYGRFFHGVHWVTAAVPEQIGAEVAACGEAMGLAPWPRERRDQVGMTLAAWGTRGPGLVVLDNLEDVAAARAWWRRLHEAGVRVVVTARRRAWPRHLGLRRLPLDVFPPAESRAFLREYVTETQGRDEDLDALAGRLGHLPLALELAGRYLEGQPWLAVGDYLGRLADVLADPAFAGWGDELGSATDHDPDLMATFDLSWQQVVGEGARRAFLAAAWCAPKHAIPPAVLAQAAELDEAACGEALARLAGLGLVEAEAAGPAVHRLVAEYGRAVGAAGAFDALAAVADALAPLATEANETGLPAQFAPLRPHVRAAAEAAEAAGLEDAGRLWNELGFHLWMVAEYAGARAAYERAIAIWETHLGPEHGYVATAVNNLGMVLKDLGDLAGARAAYERALRIDEAAFGPDHPNVAIDVNNLGGVLKDLGDLAGARAAFERALRIGEAAFGPDHPNVATLVNNLGMVLKDEGDLAGARAAYERAIEIGEAAFGKEHPQVAIYVNNLGGVLQAEGDLAGARAAYERALRIDEAAFGPDHPAVARDVNNLGRVLQALGDLPGARAACERALRIDEAAFGPDHPNVAIRVNNLGQVLQEEGDLAGARAAYERALGIFERALPAGHPSIETVRGNLAVVVAAMEGSG